jgi:iron complex transport system substrate-binding protein
MIASKPTTCSASQCPVASSAAGRVALIAALTSLTLCCAGVASARSAFPVTVRDALGNTVTVRAEPRRIVSLAPAMTEVMFALGLDKRIVGVTEYCDYPPAARVKPKIGGIVNPSVERILAQQPDLVIGMRLNPKPVLRSLARAGVPTFAAEPRSIEDVLATISTVGALTGAAGAARNLTREMRARLQAVQKMLQGRPRPTVALLYSDNPLWIAGAATFPDHVIRLAGGRNAAADIKGYKQYNVETLLARNPDVIFLTSMKGGNDAAHVREFARRPSMRALSAVKRNRVYVIDADLVDRAGPRIVDGVAEMAAKLHPEMSRNHESTKPRR